MLTDKSISGIKGSSSSRVVVVVYSDGLVVTFMPVTEIIHMIIVSDHSNSVSSIHVTTKLTPVAHVGIVIVVLFAV